MLSEAFYWLFNMSIAASLAGAAVLILRRFKRIPRRVIAVIWAVSFIRMWIPFGIGGKYGLMTILSQFTTKTVTVYEGKFLDLTSMNVIVAARSYFPVTYKINLVGEVFSVASVIWVIVAAALMLAFAMIYFVTVREIKGACLLYDNVYLSDKVTSPSVYGVFRPKIVIPTAMKDDENLHYILLHEQKHIRRIDNLRRILAFAGAALHWFNPLAWVFLKLFLADIEIACDESVLQNLDGSEKNNYALALVSCAERKTLFVSAFGGAKIRTRIEHIMSYKKNDRHVGGRIRRAGCRHCIFPADKRRMICRLHRI